MTTLLLMRHGETIDNARQLMQGQMQGELNDVGISQAEQVRDELAGTHIDAFVSSDLKRAIDTALIVAAPHGLRVDTTPLLRERDWGDFTGRYIPELTDQPWPDNVEKLDHLLERARQFLTFIQEKYEGKKVLAVGHGIINKAVQAVYYDCQMKEVARMTNAEIRQLDLEGHFLPKTSQETTKGKIFRFKR